ncbi:MAG: hypothetical protein ACRDF4_09835 [Rhabdochlamydiaceae bacterium]
MITIAYDETKSIRRLVDDLLKSESVPINDVRVTELAKHGSGIYVFFEGFDEKKNCIYVGKAVSQSLAQRIAIHFDTRDKTVAFIGGILRKFAKDRMPLIDAITKMEESVSLIIITFRTHDECAKVAPVLEKYLIHELGGNGSRPQYNRTRGLPPPNHDTALRELLNR